MNRIADKVYIGGVFDFMDELPKDVTAVIKLYNGKHGRYPAIPSHLKVYDHGAVDGGDWSDEFFKEVLKDIVDARNENHGVVIMCAAGKSRSSTISLAYLVDVEGYSLADAWNHLRKCRPIVDPSMYLLASLVRYLKIHPYLSSLGV